MQLHTVPVVGQSLGIGCRVALLAIDDQTDSDDAAGVPRSTKIAARAGNLGLRSDLLWVPLIHPRAEIPDIPDLKRWLRRAGETMDFRPELCELVLEGAARDLAWLWIAMQRDKQPGT